MGLARYHACSSFCLGKSLQFNCLRARCLQGLVFYLQGSFLPTRLVFEKFRLKFLWENNRLAAVRYNTCSINLLHHNTQSDENPRDSKQIATEL
jgi:hypothetical protein